ncbi:MATE family efflux transporter [Comamonas sp. GB3 AK4-5]|uniref:MATE family efflux transporter n=1 Tax=Comamonas sp. GB3 AK4-5 TaxID=3231487 RepID=UPI00351F58BB
MAPSPHSLTHGSIGTALLHFALPLLGGYVLQSLNGSINAIWIGRYLGEAALTAATHANNLVFALIALLFGISQASNLLVAQAVGARNLALAREVTGTGASLFLLGSLLICAAGWPLSPWLLQAMGADPAVALLAVGYLRVMFLALPPLLLFIYASAVLRGTGDTRTPFAFLMGVALLDALLNPLLIFGLGPLPRWGMTGSALASLLANSCGLLLLLIWLRKLRHPLWLGRGDAGLLRPRWPIARALALKGLPMGLQMLLTSLTLVLMLTLVNAQGMQTASAYSAAMQLWTYVQMPAIAIGTACATMAAQNMGAGQWQRVRATLYAGLLCNLLLTGGLTLAVLALDDHVLALFLPSGSPALETARHLNRIVLGSFVLLGVSWVLSGVMRATGAVWIPLLILAIGLLGVRLPVAAWLQPWWGEQALWWSFPIGALASMLLSMAYYRQGHWRRARWWG